MIFKRRLRLSNKILLDSSINGLNIIIVGSGIWFEAIEFCMLYLLYNHFNSSIIMSIHRPSLRVNFNSGGSISFVNIGNGNKLSLLNLASNAVPQTIYLVEDSYSDYLILLEKTVKPFLVRKTCRLVYIEADYDQSS